MEQLKALANDPAKLEAKLKEDWAKLDTKGEGAITLEAFAEAGRKMQKAFNMEGKEPTEEEKKKYTQILDPTGSGKVTYDNFVKFMKAGLEKLKGQ